MDKYTLVTFLESRLAALWQRIEQADAEGDNYHVSLWMRLVERLEEQLLKAMERQNR